MLESYQSARKLYEPHQLHIRSIEPISDAIGCVCPTLVNSALNSITFGDGERAYIKTGDLQGDRFKKGDIVTFRGSSCTISYEKSDGTVDIEGLSTTLESDMTMADLSGLGLGSAGAIIVAAFLPRMR